MNIKRYIFSAVFVIYILTNISDAHDVNVTPKEVVQTWIQIYGKEGDLERAVELTTLNFRDGRTKADWVYRYELILRQIRFEHLGGEVIDELTKEGVSVISLKSKINTAAGGAIQMELYHLKKVDGKWLIDDIVVKELENWGPTTELNDAA